VAILILVSSNETPELTDLIQDEYFRNKILFLV
jgi:hypothetical protein